MTGVLRTFPDLAPRLATTITGTPRSVVPSVPPELSIFSTWSRTQSLGLGAYSPSTGMAAMYPDRPLAWRPMIGRGERQWPARRRHIAALVTVMIAALVGPPAAGAAPASTTTTTGPATTTTGPTATTTT